jgi:hypothetical protein
MNRSRIGSLADPAFYVYIRPDTVAITPASPGRFPGRDNYADSWKRFAEPIKKTGMERDRSPGTDISPGGIVRSIPVSFQSFFKRTDR